MVKKKFSVYLIRRVFVMVLAIVTAPLCLGIVYLLLSPLSVPWKGCASRFMCFFLGNLISIFVFISHLKKTTTKNMPIQIY